MTPHSVCCHVLPIYFHQWPAGCSANPADGHGNCPKRWARHHYDITGSAGSSVCTTCPRCAPVSGSGHPTRAPGQKRLRQETCPLCQHHQGIKLPHRVTMQAHQYNLRILRLQPEWIAKFNLSQDNRHDYDYDYDYAAASLSPKSRLNFQLSCYLTCRLDSISFLPEERIENPGSFLPVDTYTAFHFFLKSELKIQLFFCQSIR